jgi:hypothetical protein
MERRALRAFRPRSADKWRPQKFLEPTPIIAVNPYVNAMQLTLD